MCALIGFALYIITYLHIYIPAATGLFRISRTEFVKEGFKYNFTDAPLIPRNPDSKIRNFDPQLTTHPLQEQLHV